MLQIGSRAILVGLAVLMSGMSGCDEKVELQVPLNPQETYNWCWAASAQMVKNFIHPGLNAGVDLQQCDEASKAFTKSCCPPTVLSDCDLTGMPDFRAPDFKSLDTWPPGPEPNPPLPPLDWKIIKQEIKGAGRPFVFVAASVGGGAHVMVIRGFKYDAHKRVRSVLVNDPWPTNVGATYYQTYEWYAGQSTDSDWHWRDIYGIEYIGAGDDYMRSLLIAFALLPLAACDWDWTSRGAAEQPEDAANVALTLLQDVVDEHNYKQLGFDSPAQANQAVSGKQPLDVYIVRLDKLREWNGQEAGAEALVLQSKTSEVVYPVLVDTQVKSTVSIFRDKTGYRPAMFGNAQLAETLARYRQSDADFIVRAPAFATYFIGRKTGDQVTLTPIEADARLPDFPPGKPVASIQILRQLWMLAKSPDAKQPSPPTLDPTRPQ